jgi:hypothetical protein
MDQPLTKKNSGKAILVSLVDPRRFLQIFYSVMKNRNTPMVLNQLETSLLLVMNKFVTLGKRTELVQEKLETR